MPPKGTKRKGVPPDDATSTAAAALASASAETNNNNNNTSSSTTTTTTTMPEEAQHLKKAPRVKSETRAQEATEAGDLGDLFNESKLNAPIKSAEEKWALVPAFLKLHGLVRQHIDSYDHFVNEGMKQIMLANKRVESETDPHFYLEYKDIWIGEPRIEEGLVPKNITPQHCRLRDMTYAAPIYVTVEYVRGRTVIVRKGLNIGRMPIMLRSSKCVLLGLNDEQLVSAGECSLDPGGYFIVKGTEKVILIQEQLSKNRIIIEQDSKGCLAASVTSSAHHFKSRFQVVREKDGVLRARHVNFNDDINAVVLLRALGVYSDAAAAAMVGAELAEALGATFAEAALFKVSTELEALEHIGARMRAAQSWRRGTSRPRSEDARASLDRVVLSHVPSPHFDLRGKAAYVALMMRRVLLAADDTGRVDDRDYYGNKRLELAGDLLGLLFEDLFKGFNTLLKRNIDKALEKNHHVHQFDALKQLRPDTITNGLSRAISTGNWTVKRFKMDRAGVTAVLSRLSFIAALGMMTRITSQFEKTRKISGPRALQPSQFGVLCPSDTPEGESCGLVKNLALLTHVTTGDDEAPLRRVAYNLGVDPLLRAGPAAMTAPDAHLVLLNGNVLGVHRAPRQLARTVRRLRRAGQIGEFVSIHVDERERCVHIASDGGRLCRPLLVCDRGGRPLLNDAHLRALGRGELNFGDLLVSGVVEFVDVNEENDCLIAVRETDLRPLTTHLEIAPFTLLGVVAGLIPYPHHNQSPRNTYQCAMGKQAMGNIAFNQQQRIDTVLYLLSYAQKPMVRTRTIELIGFNELPAGQNASIAVMSYSGYDIEDALVLNRASLDRGYGRCAVMRKQAASARKYPNQTADRFEFPATSTAEHVNLGRDGIAMPGSRVAPHATLINKKVPLNTMGSITGDTQNVPMTDSFTRCDFPEPVMVDQVVVTSSEEEHWLVKMSLRSTRRPELGDKFSSRHGQKGVVGLIAQSIDLPFSEAGITPDVIMNPHGFPSRMTVGKMIELVAGKAGVLHGKFKYGTAFGGDSAADCGRELIARGFSYAGKDVLTSGITGEMMPAYVFAGPVFYQKLKHMVMDKMHARSTGPRTVLTRQPTEGRSRDGGLRLGEMERDCFPAADHQLLTERGFMFLDEVEAIVERDAATGAVCDWRGLRVASYDAQSQRIVFEQPRSLIVNDGGSAPRKLVEFSHQAVGVSVVTTPGHRMYARTATEAEFSIKTAQELLSSKCAFKFLALAANGVDASDDSTSSMPTLIAQMTPEQMTAFLELFGVWLGDGSFSWANGSPFVVFAHTDDASFLEARFAVLGWNVSGEAPYVCRQRDVVDFFAAEFGHKYSGAPAPTPQRAYDDVSTVHGSYMAPEPQTSAKWMPWWVWRLQPAGLTAVLNGLVHADGGRAADGATWLFTSSVRFRDECVRIALLAGRTATFRRESAAHWKVTLCSGHMAEPVMAPDVVQIVDSIDRTWCFEMPHGFVVARRAQRAERAECAERVKCSGMHSAAIVVEASRPLITGNCLISYGASNLLVERLMISSDQFDVHVCRACGFMGYEGWCQYCKSAVDVTRLTLPYACKLLFQELQAMNVVPKLKLDKL